MDKICKLCGNEFGSFGGLHNHLIKTELVSQKDYYEKHYPKLDLFNKKPITFKNFDDYSARQFVDKKTEFAYIKKEGFNLESKAILLKQLEGCLAKSSKRFPTYCEWRSSKNIRYDQLYKANIFESLLALAAESGAKFTLNYSPGPFNIERKDCEILVDTREQKPLLGGPKTTVNVGDYTLSKENYNGVHVDRKSKADFIGTFTAGLERFKKECQKAKDMEIYLIVLVEEPFSECFRYRPLKFTKQVVTGESAFNGLRKISRQFDCVQFLFVKDRVEAVDYLKLILNNKDLVTNNDIQYLYELGVFK